MHTALALAKRGDRVIGFDNFCAYYDPLLKRARQKVLEKAGIFVIEGDLLDEELLKKSAQGATDVVHLAAQAGVRYSITHPRAYLQSNLEGFLNILELVKQAKTPLIYASSSSVYGANPVPFSTGDLTDHPVNFYGATKKANELMAYSYHHLYGIPMTGLRFFTVYGPFGRPDMAYYSFTKAISAGQPINLYNEGHMQRDFTYIDDIVDGLLASLDRVEGFHVYNLGNHKAQTLRHFIAILESAIGKKAQKNLLPMQPGEMKETFADIASATRELGFMPKTPLEKGLPLFVEWYKAYHGH